VNLLTYFIYYSCERLKVKRYTYREEIISTVTGCHGTTQCYLPPDTSEHTLPNPSHTGWYSIYLPRRDGRLTWPRWLVTYRDGLHVSSPSSNRVQCRATALIETNVLTNTLRRQPVVWVLV